MSATRNFNELNRTAMHRAYKSNPNKHIYTALTVLIDGQQRTNELVEAVTGPVKALTKKHDKLRRDLNNLAVKVRGHDKEIADVRKENELLRQSRGYLKSQLSATSGCEPQPHRGGRRDPVVIEKMPVPRTVTKGGKERPICPRCKKDYSQSYIRRHWRAHFMSNNSN